MRAWYEIRNAADDVAEVFIYDQIGEDWLNGGVTAKAFITELNAITAPRIDLHLNSPGGSVFDGIAIHNALTRHSAQVVTYVDGLAASIASIIALAGERVVMASNALFMIHNPSGAVRGDAGDMRQMADVLDKVRDTLVSTYAERTGATRESLVEAMNAETWYTAQEAVAAGFVDEVGVEQRVAASFDLAALGFNPPPQAATISAGVEDSVYPVTARQNAIYQALEGVTETFGKFDQTTGPDGAHYVDAATNPFAAEGMACANCVFYEGPRACEIVAGDIDPGAVCKLWVIPGDLLSTQPVDSMTSDSGGAPEMDSTTGGAPEPIAKAYVPGLGIIQFRKEKPNAT